MSPELTILKNMMNEQLANAGIDAELYSIGEPMPNRINLNETESGFEVWTQREDGFLSLRTFSSPVRAARCFLKQIFSNEQQETREEIAALVCEQLDHK